MEANFGQYLLECRQRKTLIVPHILTDLDWNITLLSDVGPQNITVRCWEFSLNQSLLGQTSSISLSHSECPRNERWTLSNIMKKVWGFDAFQRGDQGKDTVFANFACAFRGPGRTKCSIWACTSWEKTDYLRVVLHTIAYSTCLSNIEDSLMRGAGGRRRARGRVGRGGRTRAWRRRGGRVCALVVTLLEFRFLRGLNLRWNAKDRPENKNQVQTSHTLSGAPRCSSCCCWPVRHCSLQESFDGMVWQSDQISSSGRVVLLDIPGQSSHHMTCVSWPARNFVLSPNNKWGIWLWDSQKSTFSDILVGAPRRAARALGRIPETATRGHPGYSPTSLAQKALHVPPSLLNILHTFLFGSIVYKKLRHWKLIVKSNRLPQMHPLASTLQHQPSAGRHLALV